ncbi:MAG TPA: Mur ligase family protein [Caulobacter sp.]|nr:Mur ligase family protein [Caulobacter sp.]
MSSDPASPRHIHFIGIAGAGMSATALMMRDAGHVIGGSDEEAFPPISTYLETLGIPFRRTLAAENIGPEIDLVVLGGSAKLHGEANPEYAEARRRELPMTGFPQLIAEQTKDRDVTLVAGSFGKSSCTALLAHVLREAGKDPGYMIGAIPAGGGPTGAWGTGPMILEGDEYIVSQTDRRSKFMLYDVDHLLLTSLVHDHLNVFPTYPEYEAPFRALLARIEPRATVVLRDSPALRAIAEGCAADPVWYGTAPGEGWYCQDVTFGETSTFTLVAPDGATLDLQTQLLGAHNIENIVGVAAFLLTRRLVTEEELRSAVASFQGIRRRLDRLTTTSRVPVIEGFGSSYEKARSAIEAMPLHYPGRPLVVIFEPHTFSWRNREGLAWYDTVFDKVSRVIVIPPPVHGAASHSQLTHDDILARINAAGVRAVGAATPSEVEAQLNDLTGDEVVLLLSSGPLLGLPASLPALMDGRFGA